MEHIKPEIKLQLEHITKELDESCIAEEKKILYRKLLARSAAATNGFTQEEKVQAISESVFVILTLMIGFHGITKHDSSKSNVSNVSTSSTSSTVPDSHGSLNSDTLGVLNVPCDRKLTKLLLTIIYKLRWPITLITLALIFSASISNTFSGNITEIIEMLIAK